MRIDSVSDIKKLLKETPLVDGHNDMAWRYVRDHNYNLEAADFSTDLSEINPVIKTDIPRMKAGCMGGQFWSIFIPMSWKNPAERGIEMISFIRKLVKRYHNDLEMAFTESDIRRVFASGKIASLMGIEGGHIVEGSLENIKQFYDMGVRYLILGATAATELADAEVGEAKHGGLSPLGVKAVELMNRLGMMIDLSHASENTMNDVLNISKSPIIFSHSNTRALCNNLRNVPDDVLKRLAKNGGVCGVTFVPMFTNEPSRIYSKKLFKEWNRLEELYPNNPLKVKEEVEVYRKEHKPPSCTLKDLADHVDHIRDIAGIDHISIGSDFGGIRRTPEGLEDVSCYPAFLAEIASRGYSDEDIKKIAGENLLRVMKNVEDISNLS